MLPGYPIDPRQMSLDEVRNYFSGDAIVCLRCGKSYRSLGVHLKMAHSMTDDDYKGMYGLPWSRGLACNESRGLRRESALAAADIDQLRERLVVAREKRTGKQRPRQAFRDEVAAMNLKGKAQS